MPGGQGHSWFDLEVTSEHVHEAGEGGQGYSWFTLDVVSEHVPEGENFPVGKTVQIPYDILAPVPEPVPEFGGSGQRFTFGPLRRKEFQRLYNATSELQRVYTKQVRATVPGPTVVRAEVQASLQFHQHVSFSVEASREPNVQLGNLFKEDEELILLI